MQRLKKLNNLNPTTIRPQIDGAYGVGRMADGSKRRMSAGLQAPSRRIRRRATILCVLRRREEVKSIVDWMDEKQGRGWKKRMQFRDGYMNENIPPRWVRGSVYPRQSSVERLRDYAARFGYGQTTPAPVALAPERTVELANSPRALGSLSLCGCGSSGRWGREARVLPFRCACYQLSAVGFCRTAVVVSKKQILNIRFVVRAGVERSRVLALGHSSTLSGALCSLEEMPATCATRPPHRGDESLRTH